MKRTAIILLVMGLLFFIGNGVCQAAKPIVIGCPLSTGFLYGWDAERAIKLAVQEINAKGGVKVGKTKRPFKVEVIDTRDLEPGVPVSEALMAVEKLILEKKADFIIGGPIRSEAALAAMDLLRKYKKISILTTGALTPKYHARVAKYYNKYKYCFRITSDAKQMVMDMIAVFMQIKREHAFKRVYIMVQDVAHARAGGKIMGRILAKKGWEVVGQQVYPTGTTDYSVGLMDAKKKGAQVLLVWMDMPESSILLKQWADMKIKCLPFGFICAMEQPGAWKATGGKCEYTMVDPVNGGNVPAKITPWTMGFVNAYKKMWGLEPEGYGTSSSYMAVYVLKDAIERAGTLDSEKVIKALEDTDVMGVYGRIRFDKKSHQVIASTDPKKGAVTCIFQWQAGKRVQVYPPSVAEGPIKLPPWMR